MQYHTYYAKEIIQAVTEVIFNSREVEAFDDGGWNDSHEANDGHTHEPGITSLDVSTGEKDKMRVRCSTLRGTMQVGHWYSGQHLG